MKSSLASLSRALLRWQKQNTLFDVAVRSVSPVHSETLHGEFSDFPECEALEIVVLGRSKKKGADVDRKKGEDERNGRGSKDGGESCMNKRRGNGNLY